MTSNLETFNSHKWKYDKPLKNCNKCRYLFYIKSDDKMEYFCKIYNGKFLGKCPSKVIKTGDK